MPAAGTKGPVTLSVGSSVCSEALAHVVRRPGHVAQIPRRPATQVGHGPAPCPGKKCNVSFVFEQAGRAMSTRTAALLMRARHYRAQEGRSHES
jgi:hypothetical protein